jgi:hypothetical protein
MPADQGSLKLLNDPIALELLASTIPARFAYVAPDGTPRVIPIWFHWNTKEVVVVSPPGAPKLKVLKSGSKVALTIDDNTWPHKVLLIRGRVHMEEVNGIAPEYRLAAERYFGPDMGPQFMAQLGQMFDQTTRIAVTPEWVGLIDFEQRFPFAMELAMAKASAAQR